MNKRKYGIGLLGLLFCVALVMGCASKPVEETAIDDEYKREKTGERVVLVMVDETMQDEILEEEPIVEELVEQTEPEEPTHDVFSNTINLAEITSRIVMIKNTSDNVDWNYQAIIPLDSFYWGRELPKAGETVTIIFNGICNTDIPAPVYVSVLGNGFGTRSENWETLVSIIDDDENYVLFAQDIKAKTLFTATAEFTLKRDCENNMAVHIIYPVRKNTDSSIWTPQR